MRSTPLLASTLRTLLCAAVLFALALPSASHAAWPHSPGINLPICTATGDQTAPQSVSDGAGGAIIVWSDSRSATNWDIYAQRVLASGAIAGGWPANGLALCVAVDEQNSPTIASDGVAGAIVTWYDHRVGAYDIYAQHVLASGAVDGAWPTDGRVISNAGIDQYVPTIVSDGAGGAIIAWYDNRNGVGT